MEKLVLIERPIAEVFEYVADCRNSKGYLGSSFHFEATSAPPFGVGTRAVAVGSFMGIPVRLNYVMTDFVPNRLLRLQAARQTLNGVTVDSEATWRFAARGDKATIVSFNLEIKPRLKVNPLGMLMTAPIISSAEYAVSHMLDKAVVRLKQTLERAPHNVAGVA